MGVPAKLRGRKIEHSPHHFFRRPKRRCAPGRAWLSDHRVLVAAEDGNILGLVSVHSFEMIHRRGRLGRITSLIVAASARGRGLGTNLLAAAEKHLRAYGCAKLEVTSGEQRSSAHDFYAANGYKEERVRFTKTSDA